MPESFASRRMRWGWNLFPAFRGTGARVTYISADFREARVKLPLSWRTRNYVGTIFGGSLYGAVDPVYMLLLARFVLSDEEIATIRRLAAESPIDRVYTVDLADAAGVVHATVEKTIYIRRGGAAS